jgi:hypothetical protein
MKAWGCFFVINVLVGSAIPTEAANRYLTGDLKIACIARFYTPPSDARRSYPQVYLLDLHGKRRVAVTTDQGEKRDIQWVGNSGIIWIGGQGDELRYFDLQTQRVRCLARGSSIEVRGTPKMPPGDPQVTINKTAYRIRKGRLVRDSHPYQAPWHSRGLPYEVASADQRHPARLTIWLDRPGGVITAEGESTPIRFGEEDQQQYDLLFDIQGNRPWLVSGLSDSTRGYGSLYYEIDWKQRRAFYRLGGANIDFWPLRTFYAAVSRRSTIPYGKNRSVWSSTLTVGDWHAGWKRTLLKGPVLATSVSLRP